MDQRHKGLTIYYPQTNRREIGIEIAAIDAGNAFFPQHRFGQIARALRIVDHAQSTGL